MKLATLAHIAAVLRGGPSKLKSLYRKPAPTEEPTTNGVENGVHPASDAEPQPETATPDKGKAKEPVAVAPPAGSGPVPIVPAPVVGAPPETPKKKSKPGRRAATDPGSSPAASSSRTVTTPQAPSTRPSSPNSSSAIVSSSGPAPQTHPGLLPQTSPPVATASTSTDKDAAKDAQDGIERRAIIEQREVFICDGLGGVNSQRLLTLTRRELLSRGESYGANALIDEHWTVTIARSKRLSIGGRSPRTRVTIVYSATAARSPHGTDPQIPVAVFQAKGIPGLMTVLERL